MYKFYKYMAEKAALNAAYHYRMTALLFTGFGVFALLAILTYLVELYPLTIVIGVISPFLLGFGAYHWVEGTVNEEEATLYRNMGGNSWKMFLN